MSSDKGSGGSPSAAGLEDLGKLESSELLDFRAPPNPPVISSDLDLKALQRTDAHGVARGEAGGKVSGARARCRPLQCRAAPVLLIIPRAGGA